MSLWCSPCDHSDKHSIRACKGVSCVEMCPACCKTKQNEINNCAAVMHYGVACGREAIASRRKTKAEKIKIVSVQFILVTIYKRKKKKNFYLCCPLQFVKSRKRNFCPCFVQKYGQISAIHMSTTLLLLHPPGNSEFKGGA